MAIVGINYAPEPTGIAPYTAGLARGLSRRGHDVQVLTTFPHYPQWRVEDSWTGRTVHDVDVSVPVTRMRHYVPSHPVGVSRAASEATFGVRCLLADWGEPEVVVCISPALISSAMTLLRSRSFGTPAGLVIQDLYSAGLGETGTGGRVTRFALTALERWSVNHVDGVAVIHDRFKSRVVTSLNVEADRVKVVRNWSHIPDVPDFDRADVRRRFGWSHRWVVLHAGAMGEKQALSNVVDAARIARDRQDDVLFVLMGDGGQRGQLQAASEGIPNIQFLDPLPDLDYGQAMRSADILLVNEKPGLQEMAVPSKLTSYFRTGVPVVAATELTSTTAGEIHASGAGVLVVPGDPSALMDAVLSLCENGARAALIGAQGPKYCLEELSEEKAMDGYEAWIEDLAVRGTLRRTRRRRRSRRITGPS